LLTTAGFEDAIEIGRQSRPKLYDFFFERVPPLVSPELRFGIIERTASDGNLTLHATGLPSLAARVKKAKPEAIAICLLFSFANPKKGGSAREAVETQPLPISVSHEILPEFRESERTSTVLMNASLQPVMQKYLEQLAKRIQKHSTRRGNAIFVMQSNGGIESFSFAAHKPVRIGLYGSAVGGDGGGDRV